MRAPAMSFREGQLSFAAQLYFSYNQPAIIAVKHIDLPYVTYSLSYRDLDELMHERGYIVDHSTIQRWVVHYASRIETN